jgi:nucleotide-binding universal stress UspA family protein
MLVMSARFTRILVPMDFGTASDAALTCAKELAGRFDARLFLLHIVEDPTATGGWTPEVYVAASAELRKSLLRDAKQRLESALSAEERERVTASIEARVGTAADGIGEFAREKHIDLIVMGTHARRGLAHIFLGSVAERLVRTGPCPVLTIRGDRSTQVSSEAVQAAEA